MTPVLPEGFTRAELLTCVDRELRYRQQVYPRRVDDGKMSRTAATLEIARMRAVRAVLAQLPATPEVQPSLFERKPHQVGEP